MYMYNYDVQCTCTYHSVYVSVPYTCVIYANVYMQYYFSVHVDSVVKHGSQL